MGPRLKTLKPLDTPPEDWEKIEATIRELLRVEIYLPLLKAAGGKPSVLKNSQDDLAQAIAEGKIQYHGGHFEGRFTASLSRDLKKIGAKWDRKNKWWSIPSKELPMDVRSAIGTSFSKFQQIGKRVASQLQDFLPAKISEKLAVDKIIDSTIYKMNRSFEANVKGLVVTPKMTPEQQNRMIQEYTGNLQLSIQDFATQEIKELRDKVSQQVASGVRYESLIKTIQDSYGVSQNKAKFIARQETKLLTTKLQQIRCEDSGIKEYMWRSVVGSPAHPVRPMHKKLDGTKQSWDTPPIVDEQGNRKHPGQDYNCRCKAIPIVRLA